MDTISEFWENIRSSLQPYLSALEPVHYAMAALGVLVLTGLVVAVRMNRRAKQRRIPPKLNVQSFQIAPLGRDAYFKISNGGPPATISSLRILGHSDIIAKNEVAGHIVEPGKDYSILLETLAAGKIDNNLEIELTFLDANGNAYRQAFQPALNQAREIKVIKK
jgi:hypothetical protein